MALTDSNGGLSAADVAAVMGNNGGGGWGFGGDGAWWLLVLFLFAFNGNGWGNGFGGGYTGGEIQRGFDQQAVMSGLTGLTSAVSTGFANAEVSRCNAQANTLQALSNLGLNLADIKYTVATENCADRTAVSDGIRDVIASGTANTQALINSTNAGFTSIMDKICQLELDSKNEKIADLQNQLTMATLRESQTAQTARILADNAAQTTALEQFLNPTPIPAYQVRNPNCCNSFFNSCGCNG
jgi:hypothetical protein